MIEEIPEIKKKINLRTKIKKFYYNLLDTVKPKYQLVPANYNYLNKGIERELGDLLYKQEFFLKKVKRRVI